MVTVPSTGDASRRGRRKTPPQQGHIPSAFFPVAPGAGRPHVSRVAVRRATVTTDS